MRIEPYLFPMFSLEEALKLILDTVQSGPLEFIHTRDSFQRICGRDILAPIDLPRFDNSAMDGYAVHSEDIRSASPENAVDLAVVGTVPAGQTFSGALQKGQCVRLFTGSLLPSGADAVVMQEDTRPSGQGGRVISVLDAVKPWENVRFRGEDVKLGVLVVSQGEAISAGAVGLLGALGIGELNVFRRPRVALLATGNELQEPPAPIGESKIYESNRAMLAALVRRAGAEPDILPIVPDDPSATRATLDQAFSRHEVVVTSGGVSVGEFDCVKQAFEELGGQLALWKVALKPGKPFVFGRLGTKTLFGLPGNPVSSFVTFLLLVRPALLRMIGANILTLPSHSAILSETVENRGDRRHFMRVRVDSLGKVCVAGPQASHMLKSLAEANGLIDVLPGAALQPGASVQVLRWDL